MAVINAVCSLVVDIMFILEWNSGSHSQYADNGGQPMGTRSSAIADGLRYALVSKIL